MSSKTQELNPDAPAFVPRYEIVPKRTASSDPKNGSSLSALNPDADEFLPKAKHSDDPKNVSTPSALNPDAVECTPNVKNSTESKRSGSPTSHFCVKKVPKPEDSVINRPLQLDMKSAAFYQKFSLHVLSQKQLKMNGFPEEDPDRPRRAIIRTQKLTKWSSERTCCRCRSVFNILPDGKYASKTSCRYHTKNLVSYSKKQLPRNHYPCCNGNIKSEGCMKWPYHVTAESALHDVEFVKTESKKHLNKDTARTIYALDCEMVYTTGGMEVVKVGLVDVGGHIVFESFVLPKNQILDYNTVYSGVTEKDLKGISTTLSDVQAYLLKILNKETILVGHGLENDLKALRLIHRNVVDTSMVFSYEHNKNPKKSLKLIAQVFLKKEIQQSPDGHNCIEDARTCMELMLHAVNKKKGARL